MGETLESRKYRLIARITGLDNERVLGMLEKIAEMAPLTELSAEELERHRMIIRRGADLSHRGDPSVWQRKERTDRPLPEREEG